MKTKTDFAITEPELKANLIKAIRRLNRETSLDGMFEQLGIERFSAYVIGIIPLPWFTVSDELSEAASDVCRGFISKAKIERFNKAMHDPNSQIYYDVRSERYLDMLLRNPEDPNQTWRPGLQPMPGWVKTTIDDLGATKAKSILAIQEDDAYKGVAASDFTYMYEKTLGVEVNPDYFEICKLFELT